VVREELRERLVLKEVKGELDGSQVVIRADWGEQK